MTPEEKERKDWDKLLSKLSSQMDYDYADWLTQENKDLIDNHNKMENKILKGLEDIERRSKNAEVVLWVAFIMITILLIVL